MCEFFHAGSRGGRPWWGLGYPQNSLPPHAAAGGRPRKKLAHGVSYVQLVVLGNRLIIDAAIPLHKEYALE